MLMHSHRHWFRAEAIASSKAEMAEVQNRLLDAKGEISVHNRAVMEQGLQDLDRAHDRYSLSIDILRASLG